MFGVSETLSGVFNVIAALGEIFLERFVTVLIYPFNPEQRVFVLWLFTSLLFALFVFSRSLPRIRDKSTSVLSALWRFLFPKEVWSHASAWLDIRYFFFHQTFRVLLYEGALMAAVSTLVFQKSSALLMSAGGQKPPAASEFLWVLEFTYALFAVLLSDFVAYLIHAYQHKNPFLWEFHKIHHSPPVMHPLTNYREHPVDNIFYALGHGAAVGLSGACISWWLGYVPETPTICGVALFSFLFNSLGYNLVTLIFGSDGPENGVMCSGVPLITKSTTASIPTTSTRILPSYFRFGMLSSGHSVCPTITASCKLGWATDKRRSTAVVLTCIFYR